MFGTGGPPFIIYALVTNIDRRIVTSIYPLALGFGSGTVLIIDLLWLEHGFDKNKWANYVSLFIGSIIGIIIGNIINKRIDQTIFRLTLQFALFCGAINLMLFHVQFTIDNYNINISLIASFIECALFIVLAIVVTLKVLQLGGKGGKRGKGNQNGNGNANANGHVTDVKQSSSKRIMQAGSALPGTQDITKS